MPDRAPTTTWLASPRRGIIRRSYRPEATERADMASGGIWMFSLALMALSFGVMFTCWMVGVHKLLVFLTIVSLFQGGGLILLGLDDANRPRRLALAGSPAERSRKEGSRSTAWRSGYSLVGQLGRPRGVQRTIGQDLGREKVLPSTGHLRQHGSQYRAVQRGAKSFSRTPSRADIWCQGHSQYGLGQVVRPAVRRATRHPTRQRQLSASAIHDRWWRSVRPHSVRSSVSAKSRRSATSRTSPHRSPPVWPTARQKFKGQSRKSRSASLARSAKKRSFNIIMW